MKVPFWPHEISTGEVVLEGARADALLPFVAHRLVSAGLGLRQGKRIAETTWFERVVAPVSGLPIDLSLVAAIELDLGKKHLDVPVAQEAVRLIRLLASWGNGPSAVPEMALFALLDKSRLFGFVAPDRPTLWAESARDVADASMGRIKFVEGQYLALAKALFTEADAA